MRSAVLLCFAALLAAAAQDWVWWEGEAASSSTFANHAFAAAQYGARREGLSGGDWLDVGGKVPAGGHHATWTVEVPQAGTWKLWTRKFWKHGPFRWRFGEGAWTACGKDCALLDGYELATHIGANWVFLGQVELPKGSTAFTIELDAKPGEDVVAAFDCFLLSCGSAQPNGGLKPGQRSGKAEDGWWAFEPAVDAFAKDALVDLRSLNEREAGMNGPVRREGDHFVSGDGKPLRFWAVNIGPNLVRFDHDQIAYMARRLAKVGVNMVRIHGAAWNDHDPRAIPADYLDHLQFAVAALRKEGIYTEISFYFPLWVHMRDEFGIPGYDAIQNKIPFALLYFEPAFQAWWKRWATTLLTTPSPYGPAIGKDPGVAIVEVNNEDSCFFWTFSAKNIPEPCLAVLEKGFGAWAAKRHGGLAAAHAAWGGDRAGRDDDGGGRLELADAWHMTGDGLAKAGEGRRTRLGEQIRFLAETQRGWYAEAAAFLHRDCAYRGTIAAGNWTTADPATTGAAERWSYGATDVIDRHAYFGPQAVKRQRDFTTSVGDVLKPRSALLDPAGIPTTNVEWDGRPHIVTETAWTTINRYCADESLLWSCYGLLQGVDGVFFFAKSGANWASTAMELGVDAPGCLGQAPAFALLYRRGDVAEGPVVERASLVLDDALAGKRIASGEAQNIDEGRAKEAQGATQARSGGEPLACYVGKVVRDFAGKPGPAAVDPAPCIDRNAKTIRSATRELAWDWGNGLVRVDTPRAQGVTGFLAKGGETRLGEVAIACAAEYGTVVAISLDDRPLAQAKRILVQVFSEQKTYGYRQDADGTIRDFGQMPIQVRRVAGTLRFVHPPAKATVCDEHGYPRGAAKLDGGVLTLPADALYVVVER